MIGIREYCSEDGEMLKREIAESNNESPSHPDRTPMPVQRSRA